MSPSPAKNNFSSSTQRPKDAKKTFSVLCITMRQISRCSINKLTRVYLFSEKIISEDAFSACRLPMSSISHISSYLLISFSFLQICGVVALSFSVFALKEVLLV
jgi:hypothetical protein